MSNFYATIYEDEKEIVFLETSDKDIYSDVLYTTINEGGISNSTREFVKSTEIDKTVKIYPVTEMKIWLQLAIDGEKTSFLEDYSEADVNIFKEILELLKEK